MAQYGEVGRHTQVTIKMFGDKLKTATLHVSDHTANEPHLWDGMMAEELYIGECVKVVKEDTFNFSSTATRQRNVVEKEKYSLLIK